MAAIRTTRNFDRDLEKARKRGKDLEKLWRAVETLAKGERLAPRHRPHKLSGDWADFWECHIEPDWLLIWCLAENALVLVRTGTHSDLFE